MPAVWADNNERLLSFKFVKTLGAATRTSSARWARARSKSIHHIPYDPVVPGWKRVLDITVIALLTPVWVPVMLFIAGMIKLVSPGPVLFRQVRVGIGERKFVCLKFRTMRVNAETSTHQQHLTDLLTSNVPMKKMDGEDKRLIPCAWVLRSTGLDELPQLFNVLRGEMSLVGPRPCTDYEFARYQNWHRERFNALPGLTGLWQVSGKNRTTFNKMIELDIHYSRTSCLWLDLGIMFRTFPAMLGQLVDDRLERAFLPAIQRRPVVNRELNVNGVVR